MRPGAAPGPAGATELLCLVMLGAVAGGAAVGAGLGVALGWTVVGMAVLGGVLALLGVSVVLHPSDMPARRCIIDDEAAVLQRIVRVLARRRRPRQSGDGTAHPPSRVTSGSPSC